MSVRSRVPAALADEPFPAIASRGGAARNNVIVSAACVVFCFFFGLFQRFVNTTHVFVSLDKQVGRVERRTPNRWSGKSLSSC